MTRVLLALLALAAGCGSGDGGASPDGGDGSVVPDGGAARDGGGAPPDAPPGVPGLPVPFDQGVSYTRELVVATDGVAGNPGTRAQPLPGIREAVLLATPGTRIVVEAGSYPGGIFLADVNGAPGQPIAIVGEGRVVIDASDRDEALHIAQAQYLVLENLELAGARVNGLNIDDAGSIATPTHHLVLRGLRVHDVGGGGNHDCIKLSGVDDFFVEGSTIQRCDAGDMIDQVGCHRGTIHGNRFEGSPAGGIQMKGGSSDTLVHGNTFVDVDGRAINAGGSTGLEFFRPADAPHEAARLSILANVFIRCGGQGGATVAYVGCDGCVFAGNTLIEPRKWIARILQETVGTRFVPSRDGRFVNNLIVLRAGDLDGFSWFNVGANTAPQSFTLGSNLWFSLDDPGFSAPLLRDVPAETGSLVQRDPLLADRAAGDAHIPVASPARGAGRALTAPVAVDFDGRPYATPPSIGAFEAR